ncbi:MAG: hypothetical protein RI964_2657 [Pseudomonadota bacterium]|jgi:signal transduction histidine kinase
MISLEKQLQWHLAGILLAVMVLIWLVGSQLPRGLPDFFPLNSSGCYCVAITDNTTTTFIHRQHRFKWLFPLLAAVGIILVLMAQRMVIRRAFRQLDHIRDELCQLESGQIQQLSTLVPLEIEPIVRKFNHLLQVMQERLERSRHAFGNLAHALKSPLNLMIQYLDQADTHSDVQQVRLQAERIQHLMTRELKRARLAGLGSVAQRFQPEQDLPDLIAVLNQLYRHKTCQIHYDIPADLPSFGDREDMLELLGNLLDNACKWAQQCVYCQLQRVANQVQIVVEDDGVGLGKDALIQLTQRGIRLDESVEGHGLGLAICNDIVKLYGGTLHFQMSMHGGLRVVARLNALF